MLNEEISEDQAYANKMTDLIFDEAKKGRQIDHLRVELVRSRLKLYSSKDFWNDEEDGIV